MQHIFASKNGWMRLIIFSLFLISFISLGVAQQSNNETSSGLVWNGLSIQTSSGQCIVHSFDGFIENGHVCGILGPSGKYIGQTRF